MEIMIERANNLELLSAFLADMNKQKNHHIGFCGTDKDDILQTLKEDFMDGNGEVSFFIAKNGAGDVLAACGLEIENDEAEVWGPFNLTESMELNVALWQSLLDQYPNVQYFSFFINEENTKQQIFMKKIGAKQKGKHLQLIVHRNRFEKLDEFKCSSFKERDFPAFQHLHDSTFPDTYYDAKTIRDRLNKSNILKVLKDDHGGLIGYAYFEIEEELSEASLEYIAIADEYQNNGFGSLLLKKALTSVFASFTVDQIHLTVDADNHQANHVYEKIGFEKGDILVDYKMQY
ncbi:GNAT family N-acetyltransferase [Oceanobacillus jeddahense]|uniref:GNAT family N-acetyltransferase n=1 Tax=Oceanobacillus jeddahense TaxID=1462527 RepID=A0ABY5JXB1_9BACI|nr:GNAT family N-acetyltransferase [Oceanobacillus jeddahense]UUI03671.1 GNAT family N-acetyltransferase [Oceanobacillus jeddahense]